MKFAILSGFILALLLTAYTTGHCQTAMKTPSSEFAYGEISILLPSMMEDHSVYKFEEDNEKISMAYEPMSKTIQPSAMVQFIKKRLTGLLSPAAVYSEYQLQSKHFSFSILSANLGKYNYYNACFRRSDSLMATVTFQTAVPDSKKMLDHILSSITELHPALISSSGYLAQSAGSIQLEIPSELMSGVFFRFTSADDHIQLLISVDKPPMDGYITSHDGIKGELVRINDTPPSSNKMVSHIERFKGTIKTNNPPEVKWFTTAQITTKSGAPYFLLLYEMGTPDFGKHHWTEIINSIKPLN